MPNLSTTYWIASRYALGGLALATLCLAVALFVETTVAREGADRRYPKTGFDPTVQSTSKKIAIQGSRRLREGTLISDQNGFFREDGEGATFVADTGMEFGALPNLNLERVVRLLKNADEPSSIRWSVTGKVTEFSGRNFLLVSRALYKSATPPPAPDRVGE
jgi:hypothetical protein